MKTAHRKALWAIIACKWLFILRLVFKLFSVPFNWNNLTTNNVYRKCIMFVFKLYIQEFDAVQSPKRRKLVSILRYLKVGEIGQGEYMNCHGVRNCKLFFYPAPCRIVCKNTRECGHWPNLLTQFHQIKDLDLNQWLAYPTLSSWLSSILPGTLKKKPWSH